MMSRRRWLHWGSSFIFICGTAGGHGPHGSPGDAEHRLEKDGPRQDCRHEFTVSRRMASEFFQPVHPPRNRGRREDRAPAGTHGPRATKKHAAEPQVQPNTSGLPCAMVLRLIRDLPGDQALLSPSSRIILAKLNASPGAPGPHDFAVRKRSARPSQLPRPSHPRLTCRDDRAYAPRIEAGCARGSF